jgi:hypothetical protein
MRPNGLAGNAAPTVTTASAASSSGTLGRPRKNGMRRVHQPSAQDARRRIVSFFRTHLT